MPRPCSAALIVQKASSKPLFVTNYSLFTNLFLTEGMWQASRCCIATSTESSRTNYPTWFRQLKPFTAREHRATYIVADYPHSLRIPSVRSSTQIASSLELLLSGTDSQEDVSPTTTILTCSSLGLAVILPSYQYKLPLSVILFLEWLTGFVQGEPYCKKK